MTRHVPFVSERHRVVDIASVTANGQVNYLLFAATEISGGGGSNLTIPLKVSNFKIQWLPGQCTVGTATVFWSIFYLPKGAAVPALTSSGELQNGDRSFVIDAGISYVGDTKVHMNPVVSLPPVSRKMKGGDGLSLAIFNVSAAGTVTPTFMIDFTVTT